MVIDIWQSVIVSKSSRSRRLNKLMPVKEIFLETLEENLSLFGKTFKPKDLTNEEFKRKFKENIEELRPQYENVNKNTVTAFMKSRYNNFIIHRASKFIESSNLPIIVDRSGPTSVFIVDYEFTKEDWRKKASEDFKETSDEMMALQQLLFYMEELLKMLKKPNPDIEEMIRFLEYNVETMREEYT